MQLKRVSSKNRYRAIREISKPLLRNAIWNTTPCSYSHSLIASSQQRRSAPPLLFLLCASVTIKNTRFAHAVNTNQRCWTRFIELKRQIANFTERLHCQALDFRRFSNADCNSFYRSENSEKNS